jgi:hypothetical protein
MRIPPRAVALAACALLLATACSGGGAIGQGMASIVVPVPASPLPSLAPSSSPSPNGPSLLGTSVSGVYGGHARLTRSNVRGVSHRPQRIHWVLRPRCGSPQCPVLLISKSGGFSLLLRRRGAIYRGFTVRTGFFSCAGKPERVTLRIVVQPTASAVIANATVATRIAATLRNVSVPSPRCRRSYLSTAVVANRT